jgi:hypothetical protein
MGDYTPATDTEHLYVDKDDNQSTNGGDHYQGEEEEEEEQGEEERTPIDHDLIPDSIKLMLVKYKAQVPEKLVQEEVIHKTVLLEFSKGERKNGKFHLDLDLNSERQKVILDTEGVVSILCIGISQWSLKGRLSLGLSFDGVPGKRFINKNPYCFTLMGEMTSCHPEAVFLAKPDSWVREHFHDLDPKDADKGTQKGVMQDRRLLPITTDRRNHLYCPLGLFVRRWKEEKRQEINYVQFDTIKVIAVSVQEYNTLLKQFQEELKDTKLTVDLSSFYAKVTPSRSHEEYWGAVLVDVFYLKQ